jgi:hypothetical protein
VLARRRPVATGPGAGVGTLPPLAPPR